jgi:Ulp1 protease family, C-terminal catalytic domain
MPVQIKPLSDRSQIILENLPSVLVSMFTCESEINYRQKTLEEIYEKLKFSSQKASVKTPVMNLIKKYLKSQVVIARFKELLKISNKCRSEISAKYVQMEENIQCEADKKIGEVGWRLEAVVESTEPEVMEDNEVSNISLMEVYLDETEYSDAEKLLLETINIFEDPLEEPREDEIETEVMEDNEVSNISLMEVYLDETEYSDAEKLLLETKKKIEDPLEEPGEDEREEESNKIEIGETIMIDDELKEDSENYIGDLSGPMQLQVKEWLEDVEQREEQISYENDKNLKITANTEISEKNSVSLDFDIETFLAEARVKHPETFRDFIDKDDEEKTDVNTNNYKLHSKVINLMDSPEDPANILSNGTALETKILRDETKKPIYEIYSSDVEERSSNDSGDEKQGHRKSRINWLQDENTIFVDIEDYDRIFYIDSELGPFKLKTSEYVDYFNEIFETMGPCAINAEGYNLKNTLTIYFKCIFWNCRKYTLSGKPTREGMEMSIKYLTQNAEKNPNAEVYHKGDNGEDLKLVRSFRSSRRDKMKAELAKKFPLEFIMDKTRQVRESQFKLALLRKGNMQDIPSHGQALKMRQEKLYELHDLSKDTFEDLKLHYLEDQKSEDPYIQLLSFAPLHIMMWSKMQIQALKKVKKQSGPTMAHTDGTSHMGEKIPHIDRQLQLYAIIVPLKPSGQRFENDPYSETPVSTFITSSFTALDFKYWFMKFERDVNYQKTRNHVTARENILDRIVTDRSLALIYGILEGMNRMADLNEYFDYTYRLIQGEYSRNTRVTFVHLCCNHLMHNVSNDVDIFFLDKSVANRVKELIGAMVSIQEYVDLKIYWKNFAIVLQTKWSSREVQNVFSQLKFAAKLNVKIEQAIEVESGKPPSDKHKLLRDKSTLYENSPYFKDCMDLWKEAASITNDVDGTEDNEFYNPKFGVYFMEHYGSWFPLWTGLTWKFGDYPLEGPPSNSHVECAWANMKRTKAQQAVYYGSQTRPLKIGRLIQQIQQPIKEQVFSFMEEIPKKRATNYKTYAKKRKIVDEACPPSVEKTNLQRSTPATTSKTPKNNQKRLVGSQRIMSARSKSTFSLQDKFKKRPTRNKTRFLHQNRIDGKHSQLIKPNPIGHDESEPPKKRLKPTILMDIIEETDNNDNKEYFEKVIEVIVPNSPTSIEEKVTHEEIEEAVASEIIHSPAKIVKEILDETLWADDGLHWLNEVPRPACKVKLDSNGLCADPEFYNNLRSHVNFKVARYLVSGKLMDLTLESFKKLRKDSLLDSQLKHLNDQVIDALLSSKIEEFGNPNYVFWDCTVNSQRLYANPNYKNSIFHRKKYTEENIFIIPYCDMLRSHWSLVLVNLLEKTIQLIDPFYPNEEFPRSDQRSNWLSCIENFFIVYDKQHGTNFYVKGKWEITIETSQWLPIQPDDFNCGVFIIMYVEILLLGKNIHDLCNFEANDCRSLYQKQLLNFSLNMSDLCLACCSEDKEDIAQTCHSCKRWICSWCSRYHKTLGCILCD